MTGIYSRSMLPASTGVEFLGERVSGCDEQSAPWRRHPRNHPGHRRPKRCSRQSGGPVPVPLSLARLHL